MAEITALLWSERLLAVAVFLQTIEHLKSADAWSDTGIWRWATLRGDFRSFPLWMRSILDACLGARGFSALLWLRLLSCLAVWSLPSAAAFDAVLFFSTWLIAIRWRGSFNGGSDSMTALIALSVWVARSFPGSPWVVRTCLGYIAVQVTASYVVAGWVKLQNPEWRSGRALPALARLPGYSAPLWFRDLADRPAAARAASISLLLFECAFPVAWVGPRACAVFLAGALLFHLAIFRALGLNRFVFAWLAGYPALAFWALRR